MRHAACGTRHAAHHADIIGRMMQQGVCSADERVRARAAYCPPAGWERFACAYLERIEEAMGLLQHTDDRWTDGGLRAHRRTAGRIHAELAATEFRCRFAEMFLADVVGRVCRIGCVIGGIWVFCFDRYVGCKQLSGMTCIGGTVLRNV